MKRLKHFFLGTKNIEKSSYIWNVIACTSSSFQSMLLLLVISRCSQTEDAAIFTIAYSVGSLLLFVGKYGVRNFQVSDINHEFSYEEYKRNRIITVLIMAISSIIYVLHGYYTKNYTIYKCLCMMTLIAPKIVEAFEDVLHGHFHQSGRLDVSAKIWGSRNIIYIISFSAIYLYTRDLLFTGVFTAIISLILCILFNLSVKDTFARENRFNKKSLWLLFKKCFPLALSTTLMAYVANAPKYAVDGIVSSQEQTSFSVIFMPVFVMSLLGNYIFNPMISKLSILWEDKKEKEFLKTIGKIIGIVCLITLVVLIGGETLGIILLEILYKVELTAYRTHMGILICSGGLLALLNFTIIIATIVRKQNLMQCAIIIGTVLWLLFSKKILTSLGLLSLIVFFIIILLVILLIAGIGIYHYIKTKKIKI